MSSSMAGAAAAGLSTKSTPGFIGGSEWLSLYGIGYVEHAKACERQVANGGLVACWDLGYLRRSTNDWANYLRVSINGAHPSHSMLDATEPDPSRWNRLNIRVHDAHDKDGPVIVVGMGRKSREYLGDWDWEWDALGAARQRFGDRVVYRPKLNKKQAYDGVDWPRKSVGGQIEDVLNGASLVICRHSNVAIDACIAGIPVECEAGAAHWLYRRGPEPSERERMDFLYRLCWWQWQTNEKDMEQAWRFLEKVTS